MQNGIDKYEDLNRLLLRISQRQQGSHHSQINVLNVAYSLGFETAYALELIDYLRVHGYIELNHFDHICMLTPEGWKEANRNSAVA